MDNNDRGLVLPSIPKDGYYEDYVAAILNAGGYYLDRSVHRTKNGIDVLELDIVATKFAPENTSSMIIEVKSGGWGIKDLFKVNGWLNYLKKDRAAFIYQKASENKDEATMQDVAKELNIDLLSNLLTSENTIDNGAILECFKINLQEVPMPVLYAFRYAYDLERMMLDFIRGFMRDNPDYLTPRRVYEYFRRLVDDSFFIYDPIKRLKFLTDLSMEHKSIACILDNELKDRGVLKPEGCKFDDLFEIENPLKMQLRPVDVALHVQLLNRLYVVKGIVEYLLQPAEEGQTELEKFVKKLDYMSLNYNITNGIKNLESHPNFYLYPYFYQVFFYVFGGFFMLTKEQEEYELLSHLTGLPVEDVNKALVFWDELFPLSKSWMYTMNNEGIRYMKFVPSPLRGIGVNFRKHFYAPKGVTDSETQFKNLKEIVGEKPYRDLMHWNNMAYAMLAQDPNLHQGSTGQISKFEVHLKDVEQYVQSCGIYSEIKPLVDFVADKNRNSLKVQGFYCEMDDHSYDLYIVKKDNNLLNYPINHIFNVLPQLNQGLLRHCYVIGTDEKKKDNDDTIWFTCTAHNSNLRQLYPLVSEANKLS